MMDDPRPEESVKRRTRKESEEQVGTKTRNEEDEA